MAGAFAAAAMAAGAVMYMHKVTGVWSILPGLLSVLAVMFFWWKDIVHRSVVERVHTKIAEIGLRYGMALFIASEVMFFVAFFWAFFDASLYAGQENMPARLEYTQGVWPPPQIRDPAV